MNSFLKMSSSPELISSPEFIPLDNCSSYKPMGIQNNVFELNDQYFYIKDIPARNNRIDKITPLLEHDELVEHGIYVYVIVSSTSAQSPYFSNTPTLFYKETLSNQEIQTKHSDLLYDICNLKNKKRKIDNINSDSNEHIKYKFQPDKIYFAGEFKYYIKNKKKTIEFNFLSGTYMAGFIDAMYPKPEQTYNCIKIFEQTLQTLRRKIDITFTTNLMLNDFKITSSILNDFLHAGAEIYVAPKSAFNDINQIQKLINNYLFIDAHISQAKKQLVSNIRFSTTQEEKDLHQKNYDTKIIELQKNILDLSGKGPFKKVESTDMIGGRKSKSKCKSKKNKNDKKSTCKSRKNKNNKKSKSK